MGGRISRPAANLNEKPPPAIEYCCIAGGQFFFLSHDTWNDLDSENAHNQSLPKCIPLPTVEDGYMINLPAGDVLVQKMSLADLRELCADHGVPHQRHMPPNEDHWAFRILRFVPKRTKVEDTDADETAVKDGTKTSKFSLFSWMKKIQSPLSRESEPEEEEDADDELDEVSQIDNEDEVNNEVEEEVDAREVEETWEDAHESCGRTGSVRTSISRGTPTFVERSSSQDYQQEAKDVVRSRMISADAKIIDAPESPPGPPSAALLIGPAAAPAKWAQSLNTLTDKVESGTSDEEILTKSLRMKSVRRKRGSGGNLPPEWHNFDLDGSSPSPTPNGPDESRSQSRRSRKATKSPSTATRRRRTAAAAPPKSQDLSPMAPSSKRPVSKRRRNTSKNVILASSDEEDYL